MSQIGTLNQTDWNKIGTGALIAMGGALVAYLSTVITDIDFGEYAYIAVPVASIILNFLRKLIENIK